MDISVKQNFASSWWLTDVQCCCWSLAMAPWMPTLAAADPKQSWAASLDDKLPFSYSWNKSARWSKQDTKIHWNQNKTNKQTKWHFTLTDKIPTTKTDELSKVWTLLSRGNGSVHGKAGEKIFWNPNSSSQFWAFESGSQSANKFQDSMPPSASQETSTPRQQDHLLQKAAYQWEYQHIPRCCGDIGVLHWLQWCVRAAISDGIFPGS